MDHPVGFLAEGQEHKVCKFNRSTYGLKQSSKQWYLRFHRAVITYGFVMTNEHHCAYVNRSEGNL